MKIRILENFISFKINDVLDAIKSPTANEYKVFDKDGLTWSFFTDSTPKCEEVVEEEPLYELKTETTVYDNDADVLNRLSKFVSEIKFK